MDRISAQPKVTMMSANACRVCELKIKHCKKLFQRMIFNEDWINYQTHVVQILRAFRRCDVV